MRGSAWLLPSIAIALWLAAAAGPGIGAVGTLAATSAGAGAAGYEPIRPLGVLLLETTGYATLVTVGAVVLGWGPGRLIGARGRAFVPVSVMLLLPMCLPAYTVFYLWWQLWPADSAFHAWAVHHELVTVLRQATLVVGLVAWSWPIVAWCVAGSIAQAPAEHEEMLALDGAGPLRRLGARLRASGRGLGIGALVVFLVAFDNTTCFDLAQIFTYGNELRAKDALGAPAAALLRTAAPALLVVAMGAAGVWFALAGRAAGSARPGSRPPGPAPAMITATLLLVTIVVPLTLLAWRVHPWDRIEPFLTLYGPDLARSLVRAVFAGVLAGLVAAGLAAAWLDHRRWVRGAAHVQAVVWLIAAFVPATIAGVALEASYNTAPLADLVYHRDAILVLAYLTRFGFVAALLGRWAATREPRTQADLRRTDGASGLVGILLAARPRFVASAAAASAITFVLALGEVAVTARVHPPGSNPLVMVLLNDMHYQRPQTVLVAVLLLFVLAVGAAIVTATLAGGGRRLARRAGSKPLLVLLMLMMLLPLLVVPGCGRDPGAAEALDPRLVFGSPGTALGQFSYPRAMAVDGARRYLYVVDKTARVQRFGFDGVAQTQWAMPAREQGKPTGVSVAPDGRVFVADTHYYRVIAYDPDGNEVMRFGSYGQGPGQFIYTTHVAFAPDGRLYVAEYGGHDRIQIFSPDGEYLSEFGSFGERVGEYDRPQAIEFNPAGTELYIADACNHRIVVTDPDGNVLRTFGGAGTGPGRLHYPYGFTFLDDGTLLVSEFGNNRLQRFTPEGKPLGIFGRLGAGEGELRYPWSVSSFEDVVFVLDSGNNRVQVIDAP